MKERRTIQVGNHPAEKRLSYLRLALLWSFAALLLQSCRDKELARLTRVYGKVTDHAGQPVDSVTILFAGHKGVSGGIPIKETLTNSSGSYELAVDVPRKYLYASITLSLGTESLLSKYSFQNMLIYENGVQKGNCCFVTIGNKTKYDFVLLPK